MTKNHLPAILIVFVSFLLISFAKASKQNNITVPVPVENTVVTDSTSTETAEKISLSASLYNELNLEQAGLSLETVEYAVNGYQKLEAQGLVNNEYLTIIDMGQSSRKKRFYTIDMENRELVWNTFVSHGKNSGVDMATKFSNAFNSEASSLGFYVTTNTYRGKHGLSLRINGQEEGFNNNALARGVVVHGAAYVNESRVNSAFMGRSQGCPALPQKEYAQVINTIKDGSVMFIYHPTHKYLQSSQLIKS